MKIKLSEFSKKFIDKIKSKLNESSLLEEERKFLKQEVLFFCKNESLIHDFYSLLETGKCGTENKPNSFIFYFFGLTSKKPDFSMGFRYDFVVDYENSRISPPDIDIDFSERDIIIQYLIDIYGEENVALIGTVGTYKPKAAVQFTAKAMEIVEPNDPNNRKFSSANDIEAKRISKIMPNLPGVKLKQFLGEDPNYEPPNRRIAEVISLMQEEKQKHPDIFETAKSIEGMIKNYGTHAAGVVVSSRKLTDNVPLHRTKSKKNNFEDEVSGESNLDIMTTQFDMEDVESLGLLKFDFLQIDTLRQIDLTEKLIKERYNYEELPFDLDNITDFDDPEVFKTIDENKLEGLFQISGSVFKGRDWPVYDRETGQQIFNENGAPRTRHQKGLIEVIGCSNFNDIAASNAIGRPGPLICDMHNKYANRKYGKEEVKYLHPWLEDILKDTYGLMIYQEQMIAICQKLAGFPYAKADTVRKACGKKKKDLMEKMKIPFSQGCEKNLIQEFIANEIWREIEATGEYSFNLSHSAAYSFLTYSTSFLKTYYTTEFICAILSSSTNDDIKLGEKVNSFKNEYSKLEILSPEINKSKNYFVPVEDLKIMSPFNSIKGLGNRATFSIINNQPFNSIRDFVMKIPKSEVDKSSINSLIENDCFREFGNKEFVKREFLKISKVKERVMKKAQIKGAGSNLF